MIQIVALQTLADIIKSKWFWLAVFVVILFCVLRKNWANFVSWSAPSFVEPTVDANGNAIKITKERYVRLRWVANEMYLKINSWIGWTDYKALQELALTTDEELKYVAKFYKDVINKIDGTSLYEDLDNEILPARSEDEEILARLLKMGLQ